MKINKIIIQIPIIIFSLHIMSCINNPYNKQKDLLLKKIAILHKPSIVIDTINLFDKKIPIMKDIDSNFNEGIKSLLAKKLLPYLMDCGNCSFVIEYKVKSYVPKEFLSSTFYIYIENETMSSPEMIVESLNLIKFESRIYAVKINPTPQLVKEVLEIARGEFEDSCIDNYINFNLFFEDNNLFLENPFNNKLCDEPIKLPQNFINNIVFTELGGNAPDRELSK